MLVPLLYDSLIEYDADVAYDAEFYDDDVSAPTTTGGAMAEGGGPPRYHYRGGRATVPVPIKRRKEVLARELANECERDDEEVILAICVSLLK